MNDYPRFPTSSKHSPHNYGGEPSPLTDSGRSFAITSLVMGILGLINFPLAGGILGIIFAVVAKKQGAKGDLPTAGLVCSIISLAMLLWEVSCASCFHAITVPW